MNKLKLIAKIVELVGKIETLNANKNNEADLPELLGKCAKLVGQFNDMQDTLKEITDLVGDDIELIQKELGI